MSPQRSAPFENQPVEYPVAQGAAVCERHVGVAESFGFQLPCTAELCRYGAPPEGRAKWSLRLLAEKFVALEQATVESISHETVRQVLKKTNLSLGKTSNG